MGRKILTSLIVISTTAALIGLGTFAYFSDIESSTAYTARSGSIDIAVQWPNGNDTVIISDLVPSQVRYLKEIVTNKGRNPIILYKHTHVNHTTDGNVTDPERAEGTSTGTNYIPKHDIDNAILYDLKVIRQSPNGTVEEVRIPDPTDGETGPTLADISSRWIKLGVLQPGESVTVVQSYHLKKSTTNWAQEDTVEFTMDFRAAQQNDDTTFRLIPLSELPPELANVARLYDTEILSMSL